MLYDLTWLMLLPIALRWLATWPISSAELINQEEKLNRCLLYSVMMGMSNLAPTLDAARHRWPL
jgi:hypothetical protein